MSYAKYNQCLIVIVLIDAIVVREAGFSIHTMSDSYFEGSQ